MSLLAMPMWTQHLLILLIVGGCVAFVFYQTIRALAGKRSKLGSCCSKGCAEAQKPAPNSTTEKIHFMPVEMLTRKR
jgi:hypothetical protein